jgi:hypothetical protein
VGSSYLRGVNGSFLHQLVAEAIQPFWAALQAGEFLTDAAALAGRIAGGG